MKGKKDIRWPILSVILRIMNVKYNHRSKYLDDVWFDGDVKKARTIKKKSFRGFVDMANWLDKNKGYKWHVMYARSSKAIGLSKKVVFDGVGVWVENNGVI